MSLKTWKAEFYPTDVDSAEAEAAPVAHALRKWTGLLPKNMKRHHVMYTEYHDLIDAEDDEFEINGNTCAMCEFSCGCESCPYYFHFGERCSGGPKTPFYAHCQTGDPKPMIAALKKLIKAGYK